MEGSFIWELVDGRGFVNIILYKSSCSVTTFRLKRELSPGERVLYEQRPLLALYLSGVLNNSPSLNVIVSAWFIFRYMHMSHHEYCYWLLISSSRWLSLISTSLMYQDTSGCWGQELGHFSAYRRRGWAKFFFVKLWSTIANNDDLE